MKDALLDRLHQLRTRPTGPDAWSILTLWRERFDTFAIAKQIGATEAEVANHLAVIRDRSHHGQS